MLKYIKENYAKSPIIGILIIVSVTALLIGFLSIIVFDIYTIDINDGKGK